MCSCLVARNCYCNMSFLTQLKPFEEWRKHSPIMDLVLRYLSYIISFLCEYKFILIQQKMVKP